MSRSKDKDNEVEEFLKGTFKVEFIQEKLPKLQSEEIDYIVREKAKKAFELLKRPVLVEHTSFCIHVFNDIKGIDTNYFAAQFGYDRIAEYCQFKNNYGAHAESSFCLYDGKYFYTGEEKDEGEIIKPDDIVKDVNGGFGWDRIFIPDEDNSENKTYEELKLENPKRRTMRTKALEKLVENYGERKEDAVWENLYRHAYDDQGSELEQLAELIADKKVMLFVGAGISASLKFPDWKGLIENLGKNAGFAEGLFQLHGDYAMLAEYARLMEDRTEGKKVYDIVKESFEITEEIREKLKNPRASKIYHQLLELDFPVIYTTNYDHLLEEFYGIKGHECVAVTRESEMEEAEGRGCGCTRIMKFHGDIKNIPDTVDGREPIVLTESQYFERMDFAAPMDRFFRKDLEKYHVLFLGYGLSDINVKMLMYLAARMQEQAGGKEKDGKTENGSEKEGKMAKAKPAKAYIYTATPNLVQREVFRMNGIISFTGTERDKAKGTADFLEMLLSKVRERL